MRVDFVEPFARAGFIVIETVLRSKPVRGALAMRRTLSTTQQVTIVLDVQGRVSGTVLYGMSLNTAHKIASILTDRAAMAMDDAAWNAISELADTITQKASELLTEAGCECTVKPSGVIKGLNVEKGAGPALVVPMVTMFGRLEIGAALSEAESAKAA